MRTSAIVPVILAIGAASFVSASAANAATWIVTKTADTADGACDADCSLREAVIAANANPGPDGIFLPAGTYALTIPGANEDEAATGDLDLTDDTYVLGAGTSLTTITSKVDRLFQVKWGGVSLTFDSLTLGRAAGYPGALDVHSSAVTVRLVHVAVTGHTVDTMYIENAASLVIESSSIENNLQDGIEALFTPITITDTVIRNNGFSGVDVGTTQKSQISTITGSIIEKNGASGIAFGGRLDIEGSLIRDNGDGGVAGQGRSPYVGSFATLNIRHSTISGNTTTRDGGGLRCYACAVTIDSSTFSDNRAQGSGGAIWVDGPSTADPSTLAVTNSTISGNTAAVGAGGVHTDIFSAPMFTAVTFANNTSPGATALDAVQRGTARFAVLFGSLVAGSCQGGIESRSGNVEGPGATCGLTVPGDLGNVPNLGLGPLADNGGATLTHALLAGSPAIDHGNDATCPALDQRGIARPQGSRCDAGAFEREPSGCATVAGAVSGAPSDASGALAPLVFAAWLVSGRRFKRRRA